MDMHSSEAPTEEISKEDSVLESLILPVVKLDLKVPVLKTTAASLMYFSGILIFSAALGSKVVLICNTYASTSADVYACVRVCVQVCMRMYEQIFIEQ